MESIFKNAIGKAKALFTIAVFVSTASSLSGQSMPQVNVRFANPHFDDNTRMYFLDVELNTRESSEFLFGMNVRFFYDGTMLEFSNFDQFTKGYGALGEAPRAIQGSGQAGVQMFNLKEATVFVNGAIQLADQNTPLQIVPEKWVKAFRVCFKVPIVYTENGTFCPSVIWDSKGSEGNNGFLTGDDGLIITLLENDPNTDDVSAPSHVNSQYFNWEQNSIEVMPYGKPNPTNCVTIGEIVSTQDHDNYGKGFALFQNEPNPFKSGTAIQFILPTSQEVTFKFFDVSGKEVDRLNGEYKEGRNVINLDRRPWMEESKVIFYRMETDGFRSNTLKMVLINE